MLTHGRADGQSSERAGWLSTIWIGGTTGEKVGWWVNIQAWAGGQVGRTLADVQVSLCKQAAG